MKLPKSKLFVIDNIKPLDKNVVIARHNFIVWFCKKMKWNPYNLRMDQILVIRACEEWKNPQLSLNLKIDTPEENQLNLNYGGSENDKNN